MITRFYYILAIKKERLPPDILDDILDEVRPSDDKSEVLAKIREGIYIISLLMLVPCRRQARPKKGCETTWISTVRTDMSRREKKNPDRTWDSGVR